MKIQHLLVLLAVLAFAACTQLPSKSEYKKIFDKLKSSTYGKEIYQTVAIEMSVGDPKEVGQVLSILHQIADELSEKKGEILEEEDSLNEKCETETGELEDQIEEVFTRGEAAVLKYPALEEEAKQKEKEYGEFVEIHSQIEGVLAFIYEFNEKAKVRFTENNAEHDEMIEALETAKELISQLVVTGFLQKADHPIFTQIRAHTNKIEKNLKKHSKSQLINVILGMIQEVQADQTLVAEIITIIDELIAAERETQEVEFQVEQLRQERFDFFVQVVETELSQIQALAADRKADYASLAVRALELFQDVKHMQATIDAKTEQIELQHNTCVDELEALKAEHENNDEILELIREVIAILENEDFSDVQDYLK